MVISVATIAIGSLFPLLILSGILLFFGRGKNTQDATTTVDNKNNNQIESVAPKLHENDADAKVSRNKRLIPPDKLEKSKKELRTILLEKELASGALTRLFEAEASGEISKNEREFLGQKYRDELKTLNYKITQMDAFIEVGDLETLRDQLLQLVREKIESIERRIERTQKAAEPLIKEILSKDRSSIEESQSSSSGIEKKSKPQIPDISDLLLSSPKLEKPSDGATPVQENPTAPVRVPLGNEESTGIVGPVSPVVEKEPSNQRRKKESSDGQVEELQKELLEALDRLEKMDIET